MKFFSPPLILLCIFSLSAHSASDVDMADSLDFNAFHNDKKETQKTWKTEPKKPIDNTQNININTSSSVSISSQQANKNTPHNSSFSNNDNTHKIHERYTLNNSLKTPYSAFYVIEALHKKMAELCPTGWEKTREWSTPVENDFNLHYQFICL